MSAPFVGQANPMVRLSQTAAQWAQTTDHILQSWEVGLESDTGNAKFGDGVTTWGSLSYWSPSGSSGGGSPWTANVDAAGFDLTGAGKIAADNFLGGFQTIATAAGTTVLTATSPQETSFTGATTQTVTLPVTSTLSLGQSFAIANDSTGAVTVNSSGGDAIKALATGTTGIFICVLLSGTTAASWKFMQLFGSSSRFALDSNGNPSVTSSGYGLDFRLVDANGVNFNIDSDNALIGIKNPYHIKWRAEGGGLPTDLGLCRESAGLMRVSDGGTGLGKIAVSGGTPASASATGVAGQILWDASFIYVCVATNTWVRAPLLTW